MGKPRVLVLSRQGSAGLAPADRTRLSAIAETRYVTIHSAPPFDGALTLLADIDILAATGATLPHLTRPLLRRLPRLARVVLHATGTDAIDLELLAERGIGLTTLPDYATSAVAEHALGLLFALAQRLHLGNDMSRGLVPGTTSLRGVELAGKAVLVVGLGRIGLAFARLAAGVGLRVMGSDIDAEAESRAAALGIAIQPLRIGLRQADAVVLCASRVLNEPPLLDAPAIALLRPGAFLINVGRKGLVDSEAVAAALRRRRLRGYAVDATAFDPTAHADLIAEGRVLQTAHSAWWKDEALARGRAMWGKALIGAVEAHAHAPQPARGRQRTATASGP